MTGEIPPSYGSYFQGITPVTWNDFFAQYNSHIDAREAQGTPSDDYEKGLLKQLCAKSKTHQISWFCGTLTVSGFENLILPHHIHPKTVIVVQAGGQSFHTVVQQFNRKSATISPECLAKVKALDWTTIQDSAPQRFLWVSNSKEDAHPRSCHYNEGHGNYKLYMGNGFHRFVAYGLWNPKSKPPLAVYFAFVKI